jgi:tetratricopeptide (TPR) repeat protein
MRLSSPRVSGYFCLFALYILGNLVRSAPGQEKPPLSKSIDLDKELASPLPEDRAKSYYYFALSKWFEEKGDLSRALTEMKNALKYNEGSAAVRIEMAALLDQMERPREAIDEAQEAARIDPGNPEPHWVLANLYLRAQARDRSGRRESLTRAVQELEQMCKDAPQDERAYYALGGAYLELGETEKGIQAFEKFQDLVPNVDAGYIAIARNYERSGNLDKAVEYLQKAIKNRPESSESMMMLASLYSRQNRHKEAIPIYKQILELSNDNPAVRKQLGATLVEAGEYEEAQRVLTELAKATPDDKEVRVLLGRSYLGQRQYAQSIEAFRSVLDADPEQVEAQYYLGVAYEQSGNAAEAAKVFSNMVTKAREGSEEYKANRMVFQQHLAAAYQDLGQNDKAIALYEEMIKSSPDAGARLYFLLINAYRVNRQLDKAISLGKQQLAKNPDDVNIALVYARALADSGKTREGADLLAKALQANPSNVDIYVNLSQVYVQSRKYAEAEKILRRAAERKIDGERVKFQLATVYERQKDYDRAEELFKELLKENPRNATVLNYIGYMLADRGVRLDEAVRYVEQALEIEPANGAYLDSLGWAYFKRNDLEKAEKYLVRAVELVKNDPVMYDHLGELYFRMNQLEKARDSWSRSVEVGTEREEVDRIRDKLQYVLDLLRRQKPR